LNVIVGVRKDGASWKDAIQDGWVPGKNLFEVEEAIKKGTIVMNLLSDAAQSETWPTIKPLLTKGKVSHYNFFNFFAPITNHYYRPFTSPTVSPQSSRTEPMLMSQLTLMLSSLPPRDQDELSELSSVKDEESTLPLLSSRM
jgi:hypothetical protein